MPLSPNQAWDAVAYSAAKKVFNSLCCVRTPTKLAAKVPLLDEYDTYGLYAVWVCSSDDPLRFKFHLLSKPCRVTLSLRENGQVRNIDTSRMVTSYTPKVSLRPKVLVYDTSRMVTMCGYTWNAMATHKVPLVTHLLPMVTLVFDTPLMVGMCTFVNFAEVSQVRNLDIRCRPYLREYTRSHPNSEVKRGWGTLVLPSETGRKHSPADSLPKHDHWYTPHGQYVHFKSPPQTALQQCTP